MQMWRHIHWVRLELAKKTAKETGTKAKKLQLEKESKQPQVSVSARSAGQFLG